MHKYEEGDICLFTNKSITGIKANDGKKCRIVKLIPADKNACEQDIPKYVIEFLSEDRSFGVRENELTFLHKEIFPRLCPRCKTNINAEDMESESEKIQCPTCLFEIQRLDL